MEHTPDEALKIIFDAIDKFDGESESSKIALKGIAQLAYDEGLDSAKILSEVFNSYAKLRGMTERWYGNS